MKTLNVSERLEYARATIAVLRSFGGTRHLATIRMVSCLIPLFVRTRANIPVAFRME